VFTPDRRVELLVALGEAYHSSARGAEARAALAEAVERARVCGRFDLAADAALAYGGRWD
jgi:hypothetical protein